MAEVDSETLACTYAALILHDEGLTVNAENMTKIIKAAGVEVEAFWPGMFAKALSTANIGDLCTKISAAPSAAAPAAGGGGGAAPAAGGGAAPAAKKKEPEPEEEADMGFSLFD